MQKSLKRSTVMAKTIAATTCLAGLMLSTASLAAHRKPDASGVGDTSSPQYIYNHLIHGTRLTSSPALGLYTSQDMGQLLNTQPTMNEDLVLLEQHAKLDEVARLQRDTRGRYYAYPHAPLVIISGRIEGQYTPIESNYTGSHGSSIQLADSMLDAAVYATPWTTGYIALSTSGPIGGISTTTPNIELKRAWVTIGNLNRAPVYGTLGQMFAPFGKYSSNMITDPLTKVLFRTNAPGAIIGFAPDVGPGHLYSSIYAFDGSAQYHNSPGTHSVNGYGVNLGYKETFGNLSSGYDLGVGYISTVQDGAGMQGVASSGAGGDRNVKHAVPGLDVHATGKLQFNNGQTLTLGSEFIAASKRFDASELSYSNKGAQPMALHTELDYGFVLPGVHLNSGLYAGFDHSWQAAALTGTPMDMPQQQIVVGMSSQLWTYAMASVEYRYASSYSTKDQTATLNGGTHPANLGKHANTVLLQLGLYF